MFELSDLKYVIVLRFGLEVPIVFSASLEHCERVEPSSTVVSAGFCRILGVETGRPGVYTYGESNSLGRRSRVEDGEIIRNHLFPAQC